MSSLRFDMPGIRLPDFSVRPEALLPALTKPNQAVSDFDKALQAESYANSSAASANRSNYALNRDMTDNAALAKSVLDQVGSQDATGSSPALSSPSAQPSGSAAYNALSGIGGTAPDASAPRPVVTTTPLAGAGGSPSTASRGVRNNNPLNLKDGGYDGQTGVDDQGYAIFATPEDGLRAGALQNERHQQIGGADTIAKVIARHAPDSNRSSYTKFVADQTGLDPNAKIDMTDPAVNAKVTQAMMRFESPDSAKAYSPDQVSKSFDAAYAGMPGSNPALRNLRMIGGSQAAAAPASSASAAPAPASGPADTSGTPDSAATSQPPADASAAPPSAAAASKAVLDQIGAPAPSLPQNAQPTAQQAPPVPPIAQPYINRAKALEAQARALAAAGSGAQAAKLQDQAQTVRQQGAEVARNDEMAVLKAYDTDPSLGEAMAQKAGIDIPQALKTGPLSAPLRQALILADKAGYNSDQAGKVAGLVANGTPLDQAMQQVGQARAKPVAPQMWATNDADGNLILYDQHNPTGGIVETGVKGVGRGNSRMFTQPAAVQTMNTVAAELERGGMPHSQAMLTAFSQQHPGATIEQVKLFNSLLANDPTFARLPLDQQTLRVNQVMAGMNVGPMSGKPAAPEATAAPTAGKGTQAEPFQATTQAHVDWFKSSAPKGTIMSINGKLFVK